MDPTVPKKAKRPKRQPNKVYWDSKYYTISAPQLRNFRSGIITLLLCDCDVDVLRAAFFSESKCLFKEND